MDNTSSEKEKQPKKDFLTRNNVEHALSKLLYNLTASTLYKPYKKYSEHYEKVLQITKNWILYFIENNNLLKMTSEEVREARKCLDKIPFGEAFMNGDFSEEIDIWFDVVVYMGSCPIEKEFDPQLIIRKG